MNANCYKVIFSKRLGTLVAVGEHTTSSGKAASGQAVRGVIHTIPCFAGIAGSFVGVLRFSFASIALACLSIGTTQAQSSLPTIATSALPQGASVNKGSASISTSGAQMAINQSSDKASINWQSFNVGTGASVNIAQPSASAVLLNRVVGNDPSQILGKLSANGQVILLNPNGILFGKDGSVTGTGGDTTGGSNHGLEIVSYGTLTAVNGDITLSGTSGTKGNSSFGVNMTSAGAVTTTGGNVSMTATSQTNAQYGYGFYILGTNTKISTGGNGNVTVNAISSATGSTDALGAQIRSTGAITTSNGNINVTATSRGVLGSCAPK